LTCALGDCDKKVRKQAEEALELCGYDVVKGNCNVCTTTGCNSTACGAQAAPVPAATSPAPMPPAEAVPAPVPPEEKPQARRRGGLSQLLGLLD